MRTPSASWTKACRRSGAGPICPRTGVRRAPASLRQGPGRDRGPRILTGPCGAVSVRIRTRHLSRPRRRLSHARRRAPLEGDAGARGSRLSRRSHHPAGAREHLGRCSARIPLRREAPGSRGRGRLRRRRIRLLEPGVLRFAPDGRRRRRRHDRRERARGGGSAAPGDARADQVRHPHPRPLGPRGGPGRRPRAGDAQSSPGPASPRSSPARAATSRPSSTSSAPAP